MTCSEEPWEAFIPQRVEPAGDSCRVVCRSIELHRGVEESLNVKSHLCTRTLIAVHTPHRTERGGARAQRAYVHRGISR